MSDHDTLGEMWRDFAARTGLNDRRIYPLEVSVDIKRAYYAGVIRANSFIAQGAVMGGAEFERRVGMIVKEVNAFAAEIGTPAERVKIEFDLA